MAPAVQEHREIRANSLTSSACSWRREAPRARNTPVSRDFCRKNSPAA